MHQVSMDELAEAVAGYAHKGQKDRAGKDYINHPQTVAAMMDTEEERTVAFLHDVLEDTFVTEDTLRNLFGDEICDAVVIMTRARGEDYQEYIKRLAVNPVSRKVKLADLHHNMDLSRLPVVNEADRQRLQKYEKAKKYLEEMEEE